MGYLVALEIRVISLLVQFFYMIYSTGQINVCTDFEINRFRIDEVRKYATIVCFIWRHVTQKRYGLDTSDRYFDKEHFETNQKSLRLPVYCHTHCAWCTGISMRSFIRIHPVWMSDMLHAVKVLKKALCFIMGYLVAMEIRVTLFYWYNFVYVIHI